MKERPLKNIKIEATEELESEFYKETKIVSIKQEILDNEESTVFEYLVSLDLVVIKILVPSIRCGQLFKRRHDFSKSASFS